MNETQPKQQKKYADRFTVVLAYMKGETDELREERLLEFLEFSAAARTALRSRRRATPRESLPTTVDLPSPAPSLTAMNLCFLE